MIPKDINTIDPVARPADILIGYQSSGEVGATLVANLQPYDATLAAIAALTITSDLMLYSTGADAWATTALTPFSRTLLADGSAAAWKTTLGLAAVASSGSASDLTTGTLADARLPTTMAGKTFSSTVTINGTNSGLELGASAANTPIIDFHSGAAVVDYDSRIIASGGSGVSGGGSLNFLAAALQHNGNTIWTAGNDGSGSGLDADTVDGIQGAALVQTSRTITAGSGLTGGGDLSANRTLAVSFGTTAGTVAAGNDPRFAAQVPTSRQVIAGTGLTGGGDLSADRTFNVTYGTMAGTAAQGNDSRITGAVPNTRTISAGTGLTGGGDLTANRSFAVSYGTTAGTAAQGNDSRIVNAITQAQVLTLFNASGSAPVFAVRAWVNFNGTGTVAIRGSGNVSSITDNGTGDYIVNFTTALPNVNYAVALGSSNLSYYVQAGKTVSAVNVGNVQTTGASVDPDTYSVVILA